MHIVSYETHVPLQLWEENADLKLILEERTNEVSTFLNEMVCVLYYLGSK